MTDLYLSSENIADITIENQSEISEDTRIELLNARYMALNYEAISETAKSLCRWLAQETAEADPERKRGRRGQKLEQFESAVTAVLADLSLDTAKSCLPCPIARSVQIVLLILWSATGTSQASSEVYAHLV